MAATESQSLSCMTEAVSVAYPQRYLDDAQLVKIMVHLHAGAVDPKRRVVFQALKMDNECHFAICRDINQIP